MRRLTIPCGFNGNSHPFHVYIGNPHPNRHPLAAQYKWLQMERGGRIPEDVMDSFANLHKIALQHNVDYEELCVYAVGKAKNNTSSPSSDAGTAANANPKPDTTVIESSDAHDRKEDIRLPDLELARKLSAAGDPKIHLLSDKKKDDSKTKSGTRAKQASGDLILDPSDDKNFVLLQKLADILFPTQFLNVLNARMLFMALAVAFLESKSKPPSIATIFESISLEDVNYNLAVMLDTQGATLPQLSLATFDHFMHTKAEERTSALTYMKAELVHFSATNFVVNGIEKSKLDKMRLRLRQFLLGTYTPS